MIRWNQIFSFLQALLWNDEPAYRYFFVLGLYLFSLAKTPENDFFSTLLARWDGYEQKMARILIGTIFSVVNVIFTVLEMHILVGKRFKQLKIDRASCSSKDGIAHLSTATRTMTTTTTVKTAEMDGWSAMVFVLLAWSSPSSWPFPGLCSFFGQTTAATKPSHPRKPSAGLVPQFQIHDHGTLNYNKKSPVL